MTAFTNSLSATLDTAHSDLDYNPFSILTKVSRPSQYSVRIKLGDVFPGCQGWFRPIIRLLYGYKLDLGISTTLHRDTSYDPNEPGEGAPACQLAGSLP